MTPEEACEYLGISLDDEELDINKLEKNYIAKLSECGDNAEKKAKIEEACNILIELYDELYGETKGNNEDKRHESMMIKLAVLMAGMFLLFFGGITYFFYKIHVDATASKNEVVSSKEYESIKRELEAIRSKQEEMPAPQVVINNTPTDYTALVERVMPSMVFVETSNGSGSGFIVSPNGDILTNYHVIKNGEYVVVTTNSGQNISALVKDYDAQRDMALLKVDTSYALPFLRISDTLPKQGEAVIAIGSPIGLSGTVSSGIVSSIREADDNLWVQFTAPISHGSSGGALINLQGEVVGMPTWGINDAQNLNFAVLTQFLRSAINKPPRGLAQPVNPNVASQPQPKPVPKAPKRSIGSGIPLPNAKGFLVHKWGCSVDSIRRYVSSPLMLMDNFGTIAAYTTNKPFKAFRAKIDTVVWYTFENEKLHSIVFHVDDKRSKAYLEAIITRELTELYGIYPENEYKEKYLVRKWNPSGLFVSLWYNSTDNTISLFFKPIK